MWTPPGKNCGACGSKRCDDLVMRIREGRAKFTDCPYYRDVNEIPSIGLTGATYSGKDVLDQSYDFVIAPLPNEHSARKIVLPFRPDMTERMEVVKGDIVLGRPSGAGCPVQHVIKVLEADYITGKITGHVVGPSFSRECDVKDLKEYHMLGFEGLAINKFKEPEFGRRHYFMPGSCMMHRAHTGLVSMVIDKPYGTHVRLEDIVIL